MLQVQKAHSLYPSWKSHGAESDVLKYTQESGIRNLRSMINLKKIMKKCFLGYRQGWGSGERADAIRNSRTEKEKQLYQKVTVQL